MRLDHETHQMHRLIVSATDSSVDYPRETAVTTVIINVTDINEYTPRFPVFIYIKSIEEKLPEGTHVFTAHANDGDTGNFGKLRYQLSGEQGRFTIDEHTGLITTNMILMYSNIDGLQYEFQVKATDEGGRFSQIPVLIKIIPRFIPSFPRAQFDFTVKGNAKAGDEIGQIVVENADRSSTVTSPNGVVVFSFQDPHEYFEIVPSTGVVRVIKDLQGPSNRKKRDLEIRTRHKRALADDEVVLTVIAKVGYPALVGSTGTASEAKTVVKLSVDRTCAGCVAIGATAGFGGTPLVLLIVFLLIAVILLIVIIIMFLRGREKRKKKRDTRFDDSFNTVNSQPSLSFGPPAYNDVNGYPGHLPGGMTTSSMSEHSASVSSGRGSADIDEEIRMINATPLDTQGMRVLPDSGIQHDEDAMSEHSAQNHQEYLARLGIDTAKLQKADNTKNSGVNASVESMHQFSDEGGGEGDIGVFQQAAPEETIPVLESTQQFGFQENEQSNSGSLSSVINSEEEFSGSYNWDYLLDWGPQYQPLADVFTEIARLKDDSIKPKKVPTKIVSQNSANYHTAPTMRPLAFPPPIITDAPPRVVGGMPQQQAPPLQSSQFKYPNFLAYSNRERKDSSSSNSNHTPNSARTSQLTSMASLPKSPISYESSFTTTPLSPDFENSLSPLQHRSPSFSPIVTPKGVSSNSSGHNTPHNGIAPQPQQGLQRIRRVSDNMHPASSSSEQEFRI